MATPSLAIASAGLDKIHVVERCRMLAKVPKGTLADATEQAVHQSRMKTHSSSSDDQNCHPTSSVGVGRRHHGAMKIYHAGTVFSGISGLLQ